MQMGNAVINSETDAKGQWKFYGSHALIPDDVARQALKYCDFSPNATKQSDKCKEAVNQSDDEHLGNINLYNIYAPLCSNSNLTDKPKKISAMSPDPCSDYYVSAYLNRPAVQKALHVTNIPYHWEFCSDVVYDKWQDSPYTVSPLIKAIMAHGLRVWIYSGDVDAMVPVTSTLLSIRDMKLGVVTRWYPWNIDGEVGGYTQVYQNLTFATVRGAGHEVPMYQPKRSLSLITHFVTGTPLPHSSTN
ncbi:serine carboxypeptidase-like 40 [Phtheirospermum japonicum]|uniref:Serine carboxypeptidase-like 40 n=1 Tax=Phtheirospermum japonicum TaxID=374723 RepID=A0A830BWA9_9LAMI|nr:serine carboxypeptidase-like 40 [Phtheirospermum japonicum]